MTSRRILIVGGSTRAAADSVRRAGWKPVCADLFADLDLRAHAEVIRVKNYPHSLPDDVAHVRADGWFYCGALENHPDIIEQILAINHGPLLGCFPSALKPLRNPFWLFNCLQWEGIPMLEVAHQSAPPTADGSWLQKPLAGAGGRLIRPWDESAQATPLMEPHYFQRRAGGIPTSAIFRFQNGTPQWMGASRELNAPESSSPPSQFSYCGSYGPLAENSSSTMSSEQVSNSVKSKLGTIAQILARQIKGIQGLIGFDFRLDGDDIWLTEVNPRYTASVEILELASSNSFLNPDSNQTQDLATSEHRHPKATIFKQVLYATAPITPPDLSRFVTSDPWQLPLMADIPIPQVPIEPGWPICTVLARGDDLPSAEAALIRRIEIVQKALSSA